jgi:transposase
VKYEMLRRVQLDGKSVSEVVNDFGFSRLSFYRIRNAFEKSGFFGLMPKKRGPQKAHKLTFEIMKFVNEIIKETPAIRITKLKEAINEKFGILVHTRSIERALSKEKKRGAIYDENRKT